MPKKSNNVTFPNDIAWKIAQFVYGKKARYRSYQIRGWTSLIRYIVWDAKHKKYVHKRNKKNPKQTRNRGWWLKQKALEKVNRRRR